MLQSKLNLKDAELNEWCDKNGIRRDYSRELTSEQLVDMEAYKDNDLKADEKYDIITASGNDNSGHYNPDDIRLAIPQEGTNFVTKDINNIESFYGDVADSIPPIEGIYDIKAHGTSSSVKIFDTPVDAKILAKIILLRSDYNGEPIRLLSCETGRMVNGTCIAQELADLLGVDVYAPEDILYTSSRGKFKDNSIIKLFKPR